jgi:hypothetical protein
MESSEWLSSILICITVSLCFAIPIRKFKIIKFSGNGTQSIVWQINEETYRQTLETEGGTPTSKIGPKVYYGSVHDILSYPCEVSAPSH